MFDRRSYLDTISALRADPDKLEEIIKMKENDRRHIPHSLRPVAAVAAALALLGISVGAVNTEPVQEFLYHISTAVQVGVFRQDITTEEGVDLTIYHMPEVSLEDRDGRAILLLDGEETDITDALAQDGHYTFQQQSEGTVLDLTVTGSVQDWTLSARSTARARRDRSTPIPAGKRIPPPSRWTRETRSPVWSRRSPRSRGSPPPRSPRPAEL